MIDPFVSIVMPVFNGGDYFPRSVATALSQTYDRFEIVIVNDGSNDDGKTARFCEQIAAKHPDRIRYVDQPNGGVASALNSGIRAMRGDVFCWLSHDDLFEPHKLERQVDYYRRLSKRDAMLISDYALINPDDSLIAEVRFNHIDFVKSPQLPVFRGCVNGCTVFIPSFVLPSEPFPLRSRYTQDYWLWFDLIRKHDFFHQPELLVRYRLHPGQDSRKPAATAEAEELWRAAVDGTTALQRAQLYGSSWRFYDETHKILAPAYPEIAGELARRRDTCVPETLVSVIIPFFNEVDLAVRAARSALDQTHSNIEIIMIDDGSTQDVAPAVQLAADDKRVRLLRQRNAGAAAARNRGLDHCRGEYIAFLDGDDQFKPEKIEVQLREMTRTGSRISHTSYAIHYPQRFDHFSELRSGRQSGRVYPEVLGFCMIATPTVMIHRSLLAGGFRFPVEHRLGEDILAWANVLAHEPLLGIDEPLTIVEWSDTSAAVSIAKGVEGLSAIASHLRSHPLHRRFEDHVAKLDVAAGNLSQLAAASQVVNEAMIRDVFGSV